MKSFLIRAISATVAIVAIFTLYYFFRADSLRFLCFLAVVIGTAELIRIQFKPEDSFTIKALFYILMVLIFVMTVKYLSFSSVIFACASIVFFSLSLVLQKKFEDLHALAMFQAKSILGFLYLGLLPAFACKILDLENGVEWFIVLLSIVFAGDTLAYVFGVAWGRKKIMPLISPKKTYMGSLGGLIGSLLAACICAFTLKLPLQPILLMSFVVGALAQFGDLFESMLKRVADVKDSGSIMPGHGGILDRIDGVLFAAPFVYFFAALINHFYI